MRVVVAALVLVAALAVVAVAQERIAGGQRALRARPGRIR